MDRTKLSIILKKNRALKDKFKNSNERNLELYNIKIPRLDIPDSECYWEAEFSDTSVYNPMRVKSRTSDENSGI